MVKSIGYIIIRRIENVELRQYPKMILATVQNHSEDESFGILFEYISGKNRISQKIEMTAPVVSSEKIAMTTPVLSSNRYFSFVMPENYTMSTIPEPIDQRIRIEEIDVRTIAALRFRGKISEKVMQTKSDDLIGKLKTNNVSIKGEPFLMRYNPPFIPGFLRRNEVGIEINI